MTLAAQMFQRLADVATIITGNTPTKTRPDYYGGTTPWARPGDLNDESPIVTTEVTLSDEGRREARIVPARAILVCCIGSVGRLGIAGLELATNQQINAVVFGPDVLPEYGYLCLRHLKPVIVGRATRSTVLIINKKDFGQIQIPVRPMAEQRHIVDLLSYANSISRLRREAREKARQVISALFVEMFDSSAVMDQVLFRDLIQELRYGTSQKSASSGRPVLRIPNVIGGQIDLAQLKTVPLPEREYRRLQMHDGDILLVRTNGNPDYVGRCAVFDTKAIAGLGHRPEDFVYASYLIRVRLRRDHVHPVFLANFLCSMAGKKLLRERCRTSAGQYNINTEALAGIPVPVPSMSLQLVFVERLAALQSIIAQQDRMIFAADQLVNSLMARFFSVNGHNVSEDCPMIPSDDGRLR